MARAGGGQNEPAAGSRSSWRGQFERRSWPATFAVGRKGRAASYKAFIPDRIGDLEVRFGGDSVELIAAAEGTIRALNSNPPGLISFEGLARGLLRAEALASSAIEGLVLSHKRLARAAIHPEFDRRAREVIGNIGAMEDAIERGRKPGRLELTDLQAIHATLARGTRLDRWAGRIRDQPGWIQGTTPADARYVPPPEEYLGDLLEDLMTFINERDDLPATVQAAIAHAQLETIHPFPDGNGRVGRCMIHVMLMRRGLSPRYVPPISIVLAARRERYLDGLTVFQRGGIESWCGFFVAAALAAGEKAELFAGEVRRLRDGWRQSVSARSDAAVWPLIEALPAYPVIDARTAEALTGKSFPSANSALETLELAGILVRRDNRKRGRSWEAPSLLDLLRDFEVDLAQDDEDAYRDR